MICLNQFNEITIFFVEFNKKHNYSLVIIVIIAYFALIIFVLMLTLQNLNLNIFPSLVIPVDAKQSVTSLLERIRANIKGKGKKPLIHLVSVVNNVNDYELNRYMLQLNNQKSTFIENGFIVTAEFIKISEGDERIAEAIIDYASRLESTLLVDETLLKKIDTSKKELLKTNSSIIFI